MPAPIPALLVLLAASPATTPVDSPVVARAGGLELSVAELDPVLVSRYAMTGEGRSALDHLLTTRVLEQMARERRMRVTAEELDERMAELDRRIREGGEPGGLEAQLREGNVDRERFRELLRVSIVQERLCREALGLPPDAPVSGDRQEIWIDEEMEARGLSAPPPPWPEGVAARCGDVVVSAAAYEEKLRESLPPEELREACYQLLLAKGLRARMPDLSEEAWERAVDAEIERRRREAEANPEYRGVPFEKLLSMQGLTIETLRHDPSVEVAALSQLYVDRTYDEADLRELYRDERPLFDGRHGEAVRARLVFLRAAVVTSPLEPRSFAEAEDLLSELAEGIATEEGFAAAARRHSEEPRTRTAGGDLGWVTRVGTGDVELREAIFADLAEHGPVPPGGRPLGPVRLENGVALLWLAESRPAPSWSVMREHVRQELRRRLLDDVVDRDSLVVLG